MAHAAGPGVNMKNKAEENKEKSETNGGGVT